MEQGIYVYIPTSESFPIGILRCETFLTKFNKYMHLCIKEQIKIFICRPLRLLNSFGPSMIEMSCH